MLVVRKCQNLALQRGWMLKEYFCTVNDYLGVMPNLLCTGIACSFSNSNLYLLHESTLVRSLHIYRPPAIFNCLVSYDEWLAFQQYTATNYIYNYIGEKQCDIILYSHIYS